MTTKTSTENVTMTNNERAARIIAINQTLAAINVALEMLPKDRWTFMLGESPVRILEDKRFALCAERRALGENKRRPLVLVVSAFSDPVPAGIVDAVEAAGVKIVGGR